MLLRAKRSNKHRLAGLFWIFHPKRLSLSMPTKNQSYDAVIFPEQVMRIARTQPTVLSVTDSSGWGVSYADLVIRSHALAKEVYQKTEDMTHIGLLLPTSASAAIAALAVLTLEKVPVFLNYTASADSLNYAINKSDIRLIISSQQFFNSLRIHPQTECLFLEDVPESKSKKSIPEVGDNSSKALSSAEEHFSFAGNSNFLDRTATIVFSSGSTGIPKGVVLSHRNLNSNVNSVLQVLDLQEDDVILGALPFFHSFGFLATFWLPLYQGIRVVYHTNPMDAVKVGELIERYRCSILFATPTFLQAYIRKCSPEQLGSLRLVITGAEKLPQKIADLFFKKFGVMPTEGYGCTELSPVVSINIPDRSEDIGLKCAKPRSVGKSLPDVEVKIVDPDTSQVLEPGQEGLLLVKGPNVMQGYLGEPEKTQQVLQDGWYNTGDMAWIDEKGFIHITGRYSRFSKIGGEMIPHGGIEEEIHKVLGVSDVKLVVTGVPDARKGERLVVLHLSIEKTPNQIVESLRKQGLANLWIPKSRDFYQIEEIPLLGSGKLDLKRIYDLAIEFTD